MRYYISDLHFFQGSLNENMDMRGFQSTEEMNEFMIRKWNEKVTSKDEVYILGDFSTGRGEDTNEILRRLNGRKGLIIGNHDKSYLEDKRFDRSLFMWIEYYKEVKDNKRKVVMSHYPIMCYNGQYYKDERGNDKTYMLYGHVHNTPDYDLVKNFQANARTVVRRIGREQELRNVSCHMINVFCMNSNYQPMTLDEWIELTGDKISE